MQTNLNLYLTSTIFQKFLSFSCFFHLALCKTCFFFILFNDNPSYLLEFQVFDEYEHLLFIAGVSQYKKKIISNFRAFFLVETVFMYLCILLEVKD